MSIHKPEDQPPDQAIPTDTLVVPLDLLDQSMLAVVGGKAAQLGELIRAGFNVPAGFCITTTAYTRVSASAELDALLTELHMASPTDTVHLTALATTVRNIMLHNVVPSDISSAIVRAYIALGQGAPIPVAIRSSATTEDLPEASFAGQQESFLNMVGTEAVLDAIQRCWASLWTDRAVSYRATHAIDPQTVRLAVIVQQMVDAEVAGVLFTANPLTGSRQQAVIDANPGLGEAVVSGATTPDHYVVTTATGAIVERRLGDKQVVIRARAAGGTERVEHEAQRMTACLSDSQIRGLAALGAQVAAARGTPQDIEWACDATGWIWLLQARPITTLFPLPADAPSTAGLLRVYLCFTVQQGTDQPMTPLGMSAIRLLASAITTFLGFPPANTIEGPPFVTEAAERIFFDVTGALRRSFSRSILTTIMAQAEIHAAIIFRQLGSDPRLSLIPTRRSTFVRTIGRLFMRTRLPWYLLQALVRPAAAHARLLRLIEQLRTAPNVTDSHSRVVAVKRLFFDAIPSLLSGTAPIMLGGMGSLILARKLLGDRATTDEYQVVMRGLPDNVTTTMNLALWELAQLVQGDPATAQLIQHTPPAQLSDAYYHHSLPPVLRQRLAQFLAIYGHRSINELDLGVPRWSDDPTYVFGILASYLHLPSSVEAPDRQFHVAVRQAEAMLDELTNRARRVSRIRGWLVGVLLRRARALGGLRELPRFVLALLLAQGRSLVAPLGDALVHAGRLDQIADIFLLSLPEIHAALDGVDLRGTVHERRMHLAQERTRRHIPLVLLSDGTIPVGTTAEPEASDEYLRGTPAAPGRVTGPAQIMRDPHTAPLVYGAILVAPSTDPGWTPLFLTAGGLVTETGGAMSHGAIVAREYGLPAVVGVAGATERIATGQWITVDGTTGMVTFATEHDQSERSGIPPPQT